MSLGLLFEPQGSDATLVTEMSKKLVLSPETLNKSHRFHERKGEASPTSVTRVNSNLLSLVCRHIRKNQAE